MTGTAKPPRWAALLGAGGRDLGDEEWLAQVRERVAAAPASWSGQAGLVRLLDRAVGRITRVQRDDLFPLPDGFSEEPQPLTEGQVAQLKALFGSAGPQRQPA